MYFQFRKNGTIRKSLLYIYFSAVPVYIGFFFILTLSMIKQEALLPYIKKQYPKYQFNHLEKFYGLSAMVEDLAPKFIKTIEWDMMDKKKFYPLSMLSSFSVRCALYPLTLIKTRLQVQRRNVYRGTIDAFIKIYRSEGFSGLYKGFWVSSVQVVSGTFYISAYESVRYSLAQRGVNSGLSSLVAGGVASIVSQTIIVPFDVVSQHLMMIGTSESHGICIKKKVVKRSKYAATREIVKQIFKYDGIFGFYRGYTANLCAYIPQSALWWAFYHFYQDQLHLILPTRVSHLFIQTISGTLSGFSATILSNPLDTVRARLQVQRLNSFSGVFKDLWKEEGLRMFSKGLSARLIQSAYFSFSIILGYETIKRISVKKEYKDLIRW